MGITQIAASMYAKGLKPYHASIQHVFPVENDVIPGDRAYVLHNGYTADMLNGKPSNNGELSSGCIDIWP